MARKCDLGSGHDVHQQISSVTGIPFGTKELIKNENSTTIATSIKKVLLTYHRCRFKIRHIHGDRQFKHIKIFQQGHPLQCNWKK